VFLRSWNTDHRSELKSESSASRDQRWGSGAVILSLLALALTGCTVVAAGRAQARRWIDPEQGWADMGRPVGDQWATSGGDWRARGRDRQREAETRRRQAETGRDRQPSSPVPPSSLSGAPSSVARERQETESGRASERWVQHFRPVGQSGPRLPADRSHQRNRGLGSWRSTVQPVRPGATHRR
jgi:hypothetical protein